MKRFTETNKWIDPWFIELTPSEKLLWLYLVDNCDQIGVIDFSKRIADFNLGLNTDINKFIENSEKRVIELDNGKLLIIDFLSFQNGNISEKCPAHKPIIRLLEKSENVVKLINEKNSNTLPDTLSNRVLIGIPIPTGKGKGIGKGISKGKSNSKIKDQNKGKEKTNCSEFVTLTKDEYEKLIEKYKTKDFVDKAITVLNNYKASNGKKYASDYHVLIGWVFDRFEEEKTKITRLANNKKPVNHLSGGQKDYSIPANIQTPERQPLNLGFDNGN